MSKFEFNISKLSQLSEILTDSGSHIPAMPKKGWLHEIRTTLMMKSAFLAKRLGVDPSVVSRFEKSEINQTITLKSLNKIADALGCDVRYVLIPRVPLNEKLLKQAEKKLSQEDKRLRHNMSLEQQESKRKNCLNDSTRVAFLIQERGNKIWDDNDD